MNTTIMNMARKGRFNGVYKILEKHAGNRHYMPGELGDIVPNSPDFSLPVTQYYEAPAFRERINYAVLVPGCFRGILTLAVSPLRRR